MDTVLVAGASGQPGNSVSKGSTLPGRAAEACRHGAGGLYEATSVQRVEDTVALPDAETAGASGVSLTTAERFLRTMCAIRAAG